MLIASYLPEKVLTNEDFLSLGWDAEKIFAKTGIKKRHISQSDEFALDLAEKACLRLFDRGVDPSVVELLIYCTQSPDYLLPNNASYLQDRLKLSKEIASFDYNQGCSGYIYGLSLIHGYLSSGIVNNALLVTADTYTKFIDDDDRSTRTIFGDGATATFINKESGIHFHGFVFHTDGFGADLLKAVGSGFRERKQKCTLTLQGPGIFSKTLKIVPGCIEKLLEKTCFDLDDIDHVIFHQANAYMLEHLRDKSNISKEKHRVYLENVGNTVSSSIPIVFEHLLNKEKIQSGHRLLLMGFGIGFSVGGCVIEMDFAKAG